MRLSSPSNCSSAGSWPRRWPALVGALAWALWPKPVAVEFAAGAQRAPRSSPSTRRARRASRTSIRSPRPISGKLVRLALEAGDRVKKDVTIVATDRADGAAVPRCAHHARARGADRGRQGGRGAGRGGGPPGRRRSSSSPRASSTRASALIRTKTISERAMERARIDVDTRRAALARAKSNLEVRKRELESGQARLIGPEEAVEGRGARSGAA